MPELPDITIYCEALADRLVGKQIVKARAISLFVLRSVDPPLSEIEGKRVVDVGRVGKRIVLHLEDDLHLVIHLMISGRLLWRKPGDGGLKPGGKIGLAYFDFEDGRLILTEASSHKRASIHVERGMDRVRAHSAGGIEPLDASFEEFQAALNKENRTLKRALTNPRSFSGIGNAYSDEILHAARLSPLRLTQALKREEIERLHVATKETLVRWTEKLRAEFKGKFPDKGQITAFRPDFAAHGKHGKPCPICGKPIQRIVYAENETNYCASCQNEGRLLADRALSRLLKDDWPKTLDEMLGE